MFSRSAIALLSLVAMPVCAQVQPAATGTSASPDEDLRMSIPPPVSGMDFASITGDETRSNYLRGSVALETAYIDNAFSGEFPRPLHETTISIQPNISFDRTTPRDREFFNYTPGFTFYRPTSQLDAIDQSADIRVDYHFARYTTLSVSDSFMQTTNLFGQAGSATGGTVSGSGSSQILIIPFAEQLSDTLHATFSHQYARNQMFGFGGSFGFLNFPNPAQSPGLYDSKTGGGSGFYAYRVGEKHYLGVAYEYSDTVASAVTGDSHTNLQSFLPYYTFYLSPTISASVAAGPQYFKATETGFADATGWTPVANVSAGRQTPRTNLALSYAHTVAGGGGLLGVFKLDTVSFTSRGQISRYCTVGADAGYGNIAPATPGFGIGNQRGHRISANAFAQRMFAEHLAVAIGYERLHQTYSGISVLNNNPDSNRGYVSLNYQFARPIGK